MDDMLNQLETIIRDRQRNPVDGSYTNRLLERGRNKNRAESRRRSH